MAPPKKTISFTPSDKFEELLPEIEDEILEVYSEMVDEDEQDLYLKQLQQIFRVLRIPECFTRDIEQCVDYYYDFIKDRDIKIDALNKRQSNTISMIHAYTITTTSIKESSNIIDIIDIDKLLRNLNRLIKFRNHYKHILASWKLFVTSANNGSSTSSLETYTLTFPDLKQIKTNLNLDADPSTKTPLSDTFLIDMLGCCATDSHGNLLNFGFDKNGAGVMIKDFAEVLGQIGELN
ncbi:hypothetical protein Cantr_00315 [Candida viswanathii]|uniref:Uncharacterized protein n=1 Tax=Candida viswanathii TaxID=5486 RepID=A0A367YG04_9ASCO|nr:hypothetical protein Cantr_00315 [Candida viswanathii]